MTIDEKTFEIVSAQDYFPFGGIMENRSFTTGGNVNDKYKFTEKERDTETNYDYFGARYYDSDLGRWLSVDPLADKFPGWSSYNYTMNNPLRFIDPTGMAAVDATPADPDEKEKKKNDVSTFPIIDPGKFVAQQHEALLNGLIDGSIEAMDNVGQATSEASTATVVGLAIGGCFYPPLWVGIPYVAGVGTTGDLISTSAKTAKYFNGTGTMADLQIKATETAANIIIGKTADVIGAGFVKTSTFVRTGRVVTMFRNSHGFISNQQGMIINMIKDVSATAISTGVSIGINNLKLK